MICHLSRAASFAIRQNSTPPAAKLRALGGWGWVGGGGIARGALGSNSEMAFRVARVRLLIM